VGRGSSICYDYFDLNELTDVFDTKQRVVYANKFLLFLMSDT